jgi:cell division protein FtsB
MKAPKYPILTKIWPYVNNKYFLTFLGFLVWLSFFDRNDFITTWSYRQKLKDVRKEEQHYEDMIVRYKADLNDLRTNHETLEKYAREKYKMKKENEDVFLIVEN